MFMIWGEARGSITACWCEVLHTSPGSAAPAPPHLLEGVLKECLSGNTDLHVAGQCIRLQARQRDTRFCAGWHSSSPHPRLPTGSGCPCTHPALRLSRPRAAGALRPLYSRGRGSGTGGTSSESSGHMLLGSHPACSCKSSTSLGSASLPALAQAVCPQQPHRLPGRRKISGAQLAFIRTECEALNPLLSLFAIKLTNFPHSVSGPQEGTSCEQAAQVPAPSVQPGCRARSTAQKCLPRLESRARVLEGSGASVVVHEVAHTLVRVLHLPARRQRRLLDHPADKEGVTGQAPQASLTLNCSPPNCRPWGPPSICSSVPCKRKDSWCGISERLRATQDRSPVWAALSATARTGHSYSFTLGGRGHLSGDLG